jgi:4-hydroxybenzoate polyprenyltransferase/phosphoserine phosphatase
MEKQSTRDRAAKSVSDVPLVVDLDGTLTKVDTLHEAFVHLASRRPLEALRALLTFKKGRAAFKSAVARHVLPDATTLPFDENVLDTIRLARKRGRKIYLASAADQRAANAVADCIGEFDGVFASDGKINLKGKTKADVLVEAFGFGGFDYVGNAAADLPVWQAARTPIIAGAAPNLISRLRHQRPDSVVLDARKFGMRAYFRSLRPHQWLKNFLLFLPVLAGHTFSEDTALNALVAFVSFGFGASSIYLINDMIDLPNDRVHSEKRRRPIAAGEIPLSHTAILSGILAVLSISLALALPQPFMLVLVGYFALSTSYSFYLKRKLMIDVVALAALYGIRVVAGSAATGIVLSHWLLGFCFFIFLSLALMKRTTEIILLPKESVGNIKGRGYRRRDFPTINSLTAASGFVAVLVLALYISSPEVAVLYRRPEFLWGICIVLVYWLGRAFCLTGRGEMRQDPVIFAATDRISILSGLLVAVIFLLAL